MADGVAGTRRIVVSVCAIAVFGLASAEAVSADPLPPPPNPDLLISDGFVGNASTPAKPDDGYTSGAVPIGLNAWVGITNQWR